MDTLVLVDDPGHKNTSIMIYASVLKYLLLAKVCLSLTECHGKSHDM